MPRSLDYGVPIPEQHLPVLAERLRAPEGEVNLIYGRIRNGKSTYAARCMYDDLENGIPVYSNLLLDLEGVEFDQRSRLAISFENMLFGKREFYRFSRANFHYFNPVSGILLTVFDDGTREEVQVFDPRIPGDLVRWLNTLTDCSVYYDEGHWLLHSYEGVKQDLEKMRLITETGHVNRKIVIISQRTQSIHVNARGNVNRYFRCRKTVFLFFFLRLQVEEFQDMTGSDVDESDESLVSTQIFWSNDRYWKLFNTHTLRQGRPISQSIHFQAYDLNFGERFALFLVNLFGRRSRGGVNPDADTAEEAIVEQKPVLEPTGHLKQITRPSKEEMKW